MQDPKWGAYRKRWGEKRREDKEEQKDVQAILQERKKGKL
jgi:hypothetical protein